MVHRVSKQRIVRAAVLVAALLIVALAANVATACPSCQAALAASRENGQGGDPINGFKWSIIFMLSMPFTLAGAFGVYCYVKIRQAAKAAALATAPASLPQAETPAPSLALQE